MRLIECSKGVWVGDFEACNAHLPEFALGIHVWKPQNIAENRVCKHARRAINGEKGVHLVVTYSEGEPLSLAAVSIDSITKYARQPGKILCHCAAGASRGPTMAVLAMAARGMDPFKAIEIASRSLHLVGERCLWGNQGLTSICDRFAASGPFDDTPSR